MSGHDELEEVIWVLVLNIRNLSSVTTALLLLELTCGVLPIQLGLNL